MNGGRCPYKVLGIPPTASLADLRAAYKRLALVLHPDKASPSSRQAATTQFQELTNAYHLLSDPNQRRNYDLSHHFTFAPSAPPPPPRPSFTFVDPQLDTYMSEASFEGFSDDENGFYTVYQRLFDKVYIQEVSFAALHPNGGPPVTEAPAMGNSGSFYAETSKFYSYWLSFATVIDFKWEFDVKKRARARREYNASVIGLAKFVRGKDKRIVKHSAMERHGFVGVGDKRREEKAEKAAVVAEMAAVTQAEKAKRAASVTEARVAANSAKAALAAAVKNEAVARSKRAREAVVGRRRQWSGRRRR